MKASLSSLFWIKLRETSSTRLVFELWGVSVVIEGRVLGKVKVSGTQWVDKVHVHLCLNNLSKRKTLF